MITRSQEAYALAITLVTDAKGKNPGVQDIYKGLWHDFPVMVMTSGLAQALSYEQKKASGDGDRGTAHALILKNCAKILNVDSPELLTQRVIDAGTWDYIEKTRILLRVAPYMRHMVEAMIGSQGEPDGANGA